VPCPKTHRANLLNAYLSSHYLFLMLNIKVTREQIVQTQNRKNISCVVCILLWNRTVTSYSYPWVSAAGSWPLLDFHTWYKYSRGLNCYFSVFFSVAPGRGLIVLFFGLFSFCPPPGNFSANALACIDSRIHFNCHMPFASLIAIFDQSTFGALNLKNWISVERFSDDARDIYAT